MQQPLDSRDTQSFAEKDKIVPPFRNELRSDRRLVMAGEVVAEDLTTFLSIFFLK